MAKDEITKPPDGAAAKPEIPAVAAFSPTSNSLKFFNVEDNKVIAILNSDPHSKLLQKKIG